jgi:hypothetical protein
MPRDNGLGLGLGALRSMIGSMPSRLRCGHGARGLSCTAELGSADGITHRGSTAAPGGETVFTCGR